MKKINRYVGFTLLELLVVIAILGLIATIAIAAFQSANARARDAKRKADITQIHKALELYAEANNGNYPLEGGNNYIRSGQPGWDTLLVNELPQMPTFPGQGNNGFFSYYFYAPPDENFTDDSNAAHNNGMVFTQVESASPGGPVCNGSAFGQIGGLPFGADNCRNLDTGCLGGGGVAGLTFICKLIE